MLKYIGIFSSLYLNILIFYCIKKFGKFKYYKQNLSYLGSIKETGKLFNFTLISYSFLRIIYLISLLKNVDLLDNLWNIALTLVVFVTLLTLGIIPTSKNQKLHIFLAYIYFLTSFVWLFVFHLSIYQSNKLAGGIGISLSVFFTLGTLLLYLKNKEGSLWEIFYILMTFVWDLYVILMLLH